MLRKCLKFSTSSVSPARLFQQRSLLYQYTSEHLKDPQFVQKQKAKLDGDRILSVYCGYDPTADSLHLGNLVSIIMMARLHRLVGFRPIFLLGGATGLIGDPSGKKQQRDLLAEQRVRANLQSIQQQITQIYDKITQDLTKNSTEYNLSPTPSNPPLQPLFINNYSFYKDMNVLTYLRDVGKVLRMSNMLGKELVANRLDSEAGISYTEFSYSILQSYDFYRLNRDYGCVLQFGGSDQWGNITNGCDLTRKMSKGKLEGFGLTMPLLLTKTGQKFGKSEGNALFLNSTKTSVSTVYDYLFSTPDEEIQKLLRIFTLYSSTRIESIMKQQKQKPQKRLAQKLLAERVTSWLGGYRNVKEEFMRMSEEELKAKSAQELDEIYQALPKEMKSQYGNEEILGICKYLPDIFAKLGLCKSKNEARKDIEGEGAYLNNTKLAKNSAEIPFCDIMTKHKLNGGYILLRKGKKKYNLLKIVSKL